MEQQPLADLVQQCPLRRKLRNVPYAVVNGAISSETWQLPPTSFATRAMIFLYKIFNSDRFFNFPVANRKIIA